MSYNLNVPQSGQEIKNTTSAINTNFNVANANFGIDHVDFTNAAFPGGNGGLHNKVSLLQQSGDPAAASNTNIYYTKSVTYPNASGTFNEVFMRRSTQDSSTMVQMTTDPGDPTPSQTGNSFLPGGMIIQWGTYATGGDGAAINFTKTFPTSCFGVVLTPVSATPANSTIFVVASPGRNSFSTSKVSGNNSPIFYIAIGN